MSTTTINFTMKDLDGIVVPNTDFIISSGRLNTGEIPDVLPADLEFTTDDDGQATVELEVTEAPYYISKQDGTTDTFISYKFFVPFSATPLNAEMLYVDLGKLSEGWNDKSVAALIEAKAVAVNARNQALQYSLSAGSALAFYVQEATESANIATEQAEIATTQANSASQSAEEAEAIKNSLESSLSAAVSEATAQATTSAENAELYSDYSAVSAANSYNSQVASEAARDAAFVNANVYASIAAAQADTGLESGAQYQIVSADGAIVLRYRKDSSSASTFLAAYPTSAIYFASGLRGSLPNLFQDGTIAIETNSDRFVDPGVLQATATASSLSNVPCWRVQAAAGQIQSLVYRFPVASFLGNAVYSAGVRILAADAATGGSGDRSVRVHLVQINSGGTVIGGATTVTTSVVTSDGTAIEVPFSLASQAIDAACAFVQFRIEVQNINGTSARNVYIRDMIVCPGPTTVWRVPLDARATNSEAIAGTDTKKIVPPSALAAALASALTTPNANIATNTTSINGIIEALTSAKIEPPAGLNWDSENYPVYVYKTPSEYKVLLTQTWIRGFVDPAIWTATPYYVDATRTDNAGDGLSAATAKRDINAAIAAANTDAQAASLIYVASVGGNGYFQTRSINGSAGTVEPTKPCAFVAMGGRVRHWAGSIEESWVNDGSGTNTFTGGPSSAVRVFDRINLTNGLYTEMTLVADQATVRTTVGSWTDIGATLAIKRTDGLAPSNTNTAIYRNVNVSALDSCTTDLYFEGFDFEGGQMGALWCDPTANRNIIANNCTFRYAGNSVNMMDGFRVRRTNGLVLAYNCSCDSNWKDGFNYHTDSSGGQMYVLQINCTSRDNGRAGSSSNNGVTTHDSVILIDINGDHRPTNDGAVFHVIEDTKTWCVGTEVTADNGGDTYATAFKASNNAEMWLQGTTATTADAGDYALHAQGVAGKIHKRNHTTTLGAEIADDGAAIDTF